MRKKTVNKRLHVYPDYITLHTGKQEAGSEAESLTLVFRKSATELKPQPKLDRCKNFVMLYN